MPRMAILSGHGLSSTYNLSEQILLTCYIYKHY